MVDVGGSVNYWERFGWTEAARDGKFRLSARGVFSCVHNLLLILVVRRIDVRG